MRINTFADGAREKNLAFTSNGERVIYFNIPKSAIVKSARLELEDYPLPDKKVRRIGIVKSCSLEDFNMLEERLEAVSYGISTTKPGWGAMNAEYQNDHDHGSDSDPVETGSYAVIPIDPGTMVSANPGYYKREFELVIIPKGTFQVDLTNLISSGIPIITMNAELSIDLALGTSITLSAGISSMRVADDNHYITEQLNTEYLSFEAGRQEVSSGRRRSRSESARNSNYIYITALETVPENAKVIVDTGIGSQGILIADMRNKYAYFGLSELTQILENEKLFNLLKRTIEWTAIGGNITNLGYAIGAEASGWRKLGGLDGSLVTPDFAKLVTKYITNPDNLAEPDGSYDVPMTLYSDSPGILNVTEVRIECSFLITLNTFADGATQKTLEFDAVKLHQYVTLELPRHAKVLSATLKMIGALTNERLANRSIDETDVHGVMVSPEYLVAQQFEVECPLSVTKISLNLAKLDPDTELELEVWCGHNNGSDGNSLKELVAATPVTANELTENYSWLDVQFENLILLPNTNYWLVLRAKKGQANWHADTNCTLGGLLRASRDGGRNWLVHGLDALFKIFYEAERYTPSCIMAAGAVKSDNTTTSEQTLDIDNAGLSCGEHRTADFAGILNQYLREHGDPSSETCIIPLVFSSEAIGTVELRGLEVQCEVPSLEVRDGLEAKTVASQLRSIAGLLNDLQGRIEGLVDVLPDELLKQKLNDKENNEGKI